MLEIIKGNLLESPEQYICHQCNSLTIKSQGIAKAIFTKFPWADIYSPRVYQKDVPEGQLPGNIIVCGNGEDQRYVINMIAQFYPGKPKFPNSKKDGFKSRENAFKECLSKITQISDLRSVAFPYMIGCGLAGGNWNTYRSLLENFARRTNVPVKIYHL